MAQSLTLRFLLAALFCISLSSCRAAPQEHPKDAAQCSVGSAVQASGLAETWSDVRSAVLAGDTQHVMALVQFPLLSSGVLDSDPTTKVQRAGFSTFLQGFLAAPSGETPDGSSAKQFIASHACIRSVLNDARTRADKYGLSPHRRRMAPRCFGQRLKSGCSHGDSRGASMLTRIHPSHFQIHKFLF